MHMWRKNISMSSPKKALHSRIYLIPAMEKGLALGGLTGILAGLIAVTIPPAGVVLGGGAVLASALAGAGIGAWMSTMIGVDVPNSRITAFEEAIKQGEILMLVDVPKDQVEKVEDIIKKQR